ncbi:MAG: CRISPR-associated endonuclease Cas2 [Mariprofundaceae bacterium]|nr:CRISPR-associated endonuclease Cas2 [Mariprofundaceae bacterium]
MSSRPLYLIAYDIHCPERLGLALHAVRHYATGGQKSVFECYLSHKEKKHLISELQSIVCHTEDSCFILQLDPRMQVSTLGIALCPTDPDWFYLA